MNTTSGFTAFWDNEISLSSTTDSPGNSSDVTGDRDHRTQGVDLVSLLQLTGFGWGGVVLVGVVLIAAVVHICVCICRRSVVEPDPECGGIKSIVQMMNVSTTTHDLPDHYNRVTPIIYPALRMHHQYGGALSTSKERRSMKRSSRDRIYKQVPVISELKDLHEKCYSIDGYFQKVGVRGKRRSQRKGSEATEMGVASDRGGFLQIGQESMEGKTCTRSMDRLQGMRPGTECRDIRSQGGRLGSRDNLDQIRKMGSRGRLDGCSDTGSGNNVQSKDTHSRRLDSYGGIELMRGVQTPRNFESQRYTESRDTVDNMAGIDGEGAGSIHNSSRLPSYLSLGDDTWLGSLRATSKKLDFGSERWLDTC